MKHIVTVFALNAAIFSVVVMLAVGIGIWLSAPQKPERLCPVGQKALLMGYGLDEQGKRIVTIMCERVRP